MQQSAARNTELIDTLQRYADLFTFAPVGCLILREDSRVDDVNRAAAAALGWPRSWIAGQLFSRWVVSEHLPCFLDHLHEACRSEHPISTELRIEDRRGSLRDLRCDSVSMLARAGAGRRCQSTIIDVTAQRCAARESRRLEEDFAHAARLSCCGEMAAALAHELNQPLAAIALYCNACLTSLRAGTAETAMLAASLEKVAEAAMHASGTIRGLRSFLRKSEGVVERLKLNDVIRDGARIASAYAKSRGSTVELRLAEGLPDVKANRIHLQQVILNLLQNSIDAMQYTKEQRVVVTSDRLDFGTLRVTVTDSGPGMTAQQRRRAFEPFYTTKQDGMGVGLPISRSIIESYGGHLWAPTRGRRRGTTLSFTLPVVPLDERA